MAPSNALLLNFALVLFVYRYDAVMQRWEFCFDNWELMMDLDPRDVRTRILTSVAWVTTFAVDMKVGWQLHITNVFELHNGRWLMAHHHSSIIP